MLGTKMFWEILGTIHAKLGHHLLLLSRTWLSRGQGLLQNWRRFRGNRSPLMNFLPEEVCLKGEKNFSTFDFAQVEYQGRDFLGCSTSSIRKAMQKIAERSSLVDNILENLFLFGLER
jgi:hypothetical protein